MKRLLASCWQFLRTLSTDDAYERYLEHHGREHADVVPLTRREFYVHQQLRKWSGIQRCC